MANYVTQTSDKSKKTAFLRCLWGLIGIGGLHYFYVGRIGAGLAFLFTAGGFYVGTVIDLIRISLGSFRDNVGNPLRED